MKKVFLKLSFVLLICALIMTVSACQYMEHHYTEEITKAPSCTEAGEKTLTCTCGDRLTEVIPQLPHIEETLEAVDPTCTESGLTEGKKCSSCGTVLVAQETIPATGHSFTDDNDASCNNEGCDFVRESECEHSNTEILATVAPTCTESGLTEGEKCKDCGEILKEQETIAALGHSEKTLEAKAPTCTETGLTEGKQCTVCNTVTVAQETVAALGHSEKTLEAKAPTCTETGLTEGKQCTVCNTVTVSQSTVSATGHSYTDEYDATCNNPGCDFVRDAACRHSDTQILPAVAATCTATGLTEGKQCKDCEEILVKQETVAALGHSEKTLDAKAPTCTETGLTEGKQCTVCNTVTVAQETVAALGHTWNDATCTAPKTCSVCTATEGEPLDHTYPDEWTIDDSKHWRKCNNCEATESGNHDEYNATCFCGYTNEHRVVNGNFDSDLNGWEIETTFGDVPFAGIDEKTTFWGEGYNMFNVGKYFSSYADGASENSHGTLKSSLFVAGSQYATYMLGGAGNHNVYITIEDKDGNVLALYRNTKFADFPAGEYSIEERREMIGKTVFLANFVTYKVDISAFEGQEIRFVIHDHASSGWGVVYFDQLNTYHTAEPEGILAENLLANKDALKAELSLEIAEQGDYTLDSYNAYLAKLDVAKALLGDIAVTQTDVDNATAALKDARLALAVRPIEEVQGANKSFNLISGSNKEITLSDYINTNGLAGITYEILGEENLILSEISNGKFTITAGTVSQATVVNVKITVSHNGVAKLSVDLSVQITNDLAPSVFDDEVAKDYDIFDLDNKTELVIDLSGNVDNAGNLALTYSVNGKTVVGSSYTFTFGDYTDKVVYETLTVSISYLANGKEESISYTYKLGLKDSTACRLQNGGFENGLEGWTQVGEIGNVSSNGSYWNGEFGKDGDKMFSAYEPSDMFEKNVGTLTSSIFTVGGSGFVTFKIGAMRDANYVYVDVVEASTGKILARYYNGLWKENETHCTLVAYKADLSAFMGKEVFFRLSDNADSGYGLIFADSFITYYENEPDGFNAATHVEYALPGTIYDVFNGGFEMGGNQGWWNIGEIGVVTNANGFWGENIPYEKVGDYLFTGVESNGADTMREGNKGTLTSSVFVIGGSGYISFKLGGGGNEHCYIQIIDAETNEVLARYRQQAQNNAVLIQYVADLSAHIGKTARIQVVDYATSGWGCVSFDNVVTYYASTENLPAGENANNIFHGVYNVTNGSFENGLDGWNMNITEAGAHNTLGWVESSEHDAGWYTKNDGRKDGSFLFTFCKPDGTNCENTKGTLNSAVFTLKQGSYVSFRFGGAGTREVHLQLVRANGDVIATFYNEAPGKVNTEMFAYFYQYTGETVDCFFRVVDNSTANYGCFVVDDFRANLESAPEGFIAAIQ